MGFQLISPPGAAILVDQEYHPETIECTSLLRLPPPPALLTVEDFLSICRRCNPIVQIEKLSFPEDKSGLKFLQMILSYLILS